MVDLQGTVEDSLTNVEPCVRVALAVLLDVVEYARIVLAVVALCEAFTYMAPGTPLENVCMNLCGDISVRTHDDSSGKRHPVPKYHKSDLEHDLGQLEKVWDMTFSSSRYLAQVGSQVALQVKLSSLLIASLVHSHPMNMVVIVC